MNRDLSVSKAGESSAYENHNIRIIARDHDTLLSVTNERGNKEVELPIIIGDLLGWNVLNEHIILFTRAEASGNDYIYHIVYNESDGTFKQVVGDDEYAFDPAHPTDSHPLFKGHLGFSLNNPIESVVYYENENIQKIYWVDGKNPLRFMKFTSSNDEIAKWYTGLDDNGVVTYFDSNRPTSFDVKVEIQKDNSGNTRANGTAQYLITYFNKHGQESGYAWVSDLVYLSPVGVGGAVDGTNNNRVTLNIHNLDTSFSNFRVYSIVRTSFNGQATAYIIYEGEVPVDTDQNVFVVDDASHLTAVDADRMLFLGSQNVKPGTITHKDQTMFLGDLQSIGRLGYDALEAKIKETMYDSTTGFCAENIITFKRTTSTTGDIPYVKDSGSYPYSNQLSSTSSEIASFKGGEKYRFALSFRYADGTASDAFWIGDAVNSLYPQIDESAGTIHRVIAECQIPQAVISEALKAGFKTVQLMIAEATYSDRSVKAQGIVSPTVFNVWNRYKKGLYAESSWILRTKNADCAFRHFEPIHNSTESTGEIESNYWSEDLGTPGPYYQFNTSTGKYIGSFDGIPDYQECMLIIQVKYERSFGYKYEVISLKASYDTQAAQDALHAKTFADTDVPSSGSPEGESYYQNTIEADGYRILIQTSRRRANGDKRSKATYAGVCDWLRKFGYPSDSVLWETFEGWCTTAINNKNTAYYFSKNASGTYTTPSAAMNASGSWYSIDPSGSSSGIDYAPSYYKKHLMFVDENVVTLNSPELEYEALSFDQVEGYQLRIVGVAKISGKNCDYTVDATPGKLSGENLVLGDKTDELYSWPLWLEYGLMERSVREDGTTSYTPSEDITERTPYDYLWGSGLVKYWLHMWNRLGNITGYTDADGNDYSYLHRKIFANQRYAYSTVYTGSPCVYDTLDDVRLFNAVSSQYTKINVGGSSKLYNGNIQDSLSMPGTHKYPIMYSVSSSTDEEPIWGAYLYTSSPILLEYASTPHAVISLETIFNKTNKIYSQTLLPKVGSYDAATTPPSTVDGTTSVWTIPWENNHIGTGSYPDVKYAISQPTLSLPNGTLSDGDEYALIGELYYDYDSLNPGEDMRYGGITAAAVKSNRFVAAGPQEELSNLTNNTILANEGDTYFQRWDCLKTKPYSTGSVNNVIDITSVMLETHINIDGRSDLQRDIKYIASIDTEKYGELNRAYSQQDNFFVRRDLDEDANLDSYRSTITWSLEKTDAASVDEWSHVTLASTLKLDGDKGTCNALRRFNNSIIAFQDKGISEILFNSRTQIPTGDGVPIEIANSGKVDGKRYISTKYGCTNKWSIVEGKSALYFVDNINKTFCGFGGQGIEPISSKLGFEVWFKEKNSLEPWTPDEFNNIVSFYDQVHSDVYLVRGTYDDMACLVYNEKLGMFTSFFDYGFVSMMTNVKDKFVSFTAKNLGYGNSKNKLWLQNEGLYGNFFGTQKDFWVQYRVTPDPFGDKVWSGFDYRADFYRVLNAAGENVVPEEYLINGDSYGQIDDLYNENETFDTFQIWDEYQSTGEVDMFRKNSMDKPVTKDFRIWRRQIPRAMKLGTNKYGLDRIRNPWINLMLKKKQTEDNNQDLMQLHDVVVRYFE